MPSTYAHRRFGANVLDHLPAPLREKLEAHRELSFLCFRDALMHILLLSSSVMLQSFISLPLILPSVSFSQTTVQTSHHLPLCAFSVL